METTDQEPQQQHQQLHQNDVSSNYPYEDLGLNLVNGKGAHDTTDNVVGDHGISPTQQQYDQQYQDQHNHYQHQSYLIDNQPHQTNDLTNNNQQLLHNQINDFTQCQPHVQQQQNLHDPTTNGTIPFYDSNNQDQAQYLQQQQQPYPDRTDNKLYTNLDQQTDGHRVRFVNSYCEATSSTGNNYLPASQDQKYHIEQNHQNQLQNNIQQQSLHNNHQQQQYQADTTTSKPFVEIVEQPARCALRFRYKCEGRSAGSLPGASSSVDNKTFPSIRIANYRGRAVVVISTVSRDEPYRAHPHNIVGREGCKKGICTIVIKQNEPNSVRSFPSLGIQCVKRRDIEESLNLRESIHVDPFREGFEHKHNASNIDLNAVRLCFQVFIEGNRPGKCDVPLMPVVSNPIHDKKAMSDLVITKLSHCSAPATGGREVILLCDRITKEDIRIRFFEERNGRVQWEVYYDPTAADIHKQVAICFKTPKYHNENIQTPVMVRIQLKRISDNQVSEPRPFQFLPCESDEDIIHRKRQKMDWVNPDRYALT